MSIKNKYGSVKYVYEKFEIILIADDSFYMISEAIQSGNIPYIIKSGNIGRRLKLGISPLENNGYLKINKTIINQFTTIWFK